MHRSKLAGFIIDCQTTDLGGAARFWSRALGMAQQALPAAEGEKYVRLLDPQERLHIEVQRLAALGAKVVERVQTWCVMEAPTGQRFCVVRAASPEFSRSANEWPAG